jgi:peptidylglycine monooxygenase
MEPLLVALGERRYEVNRPWASGMPLRGRGHTSDLATDRADRLYLYNRFDRCIDPDGGPTISVHDAAGDQIRTLDLPEIADAHGISIGPADELILVDRDRHVVHVLAQDGGVRLTLGERNQPGRPFSHPTSAKVGPGGDIFVTDGYGNSQVHRFSSNGRRITSWGVPGIGPGEFSTPHSVAFTKGGEVVVCDRENNRVQIFDVDGHFIREIGDMFHPMAVVVDAEDMILVSDQIPRLSMFTTGGKLAGRCRPVLYGGHGMCLDTLGNLYFAETRVNRATRLRRIA